jgi:riboflavin kinase / FMN adenylyltransferase
MSDGTISRLDQLEQAPSVVSIGFFDGVHRGHQAIVGRARDAALERGLRSAVVTFDRHPMEVIRPGSQPKLLMTLGQRARALADLGVDLVVVLPFDDDLRHRTPEEFVDRVLAGPLQARHVVVGSNFRFGHKAAGDVTRLAELGSSRGFSAEGVGLLADDDEVISSTQIRAAIDAGEVERAADLLGRPHAVEGVVVRGDRRGAGLGFPTANLEVSRRVAVPARGVYAGMFHLLAEPAGPARPAVTSVGVNPTFGGQELRVEAHLLDFAGDLYGEHGALDFRHRIRDERRLVSVDQLVAQIRADAATARSLLLSR